MSLKHGLAARIARIFVAAVPAGLRVWLTVLLAGLTVALTGCGAGLSAAITPIALDTATPPLPTLTATLTPVWFPPTETPTPAPSITLRPTDNMQPALGAVIETDDFSDSSTWSLGSNENGRVAHGVKELTLAVSTAKGVLSSLRSGTLPASSYLEITAEPSLCSGADAFGLYLRALDAANGYRLLATCDGRIRLERLKNSQLVVLQDWAPSGELRTGGTFPVILGVWASGPELRIFVNGVYQFSARDPVWEEGRLGVYARAAGDSPLTVSFSKLVVHAVNAALLPTRTPYPTATP